MYIFLNIFKLGFSHRFNFLSDIIVNILQEFFIVLLLLPIKLHDSLLNLLFKTFEDLLSCMIKHFYLADSGLLSGVYLLDLFADGVDLFELFLQLGLFWRICDGFHLGDVFCEVLFAWNLICLDTEVLFKCLSS